MYFKTIPFLLFFLSFSTTFWATYESSPHISADKIRETYTKNSPSTSQVFKRDIWYSYEEDRSQNFEEYYAFVMKKPLEYIHKLQQQKYMINTGNYAWFWQRYRENGEAENRFLAFQLEYPKKEYQEWEKEFAHQEYSQTHSSLKPLFFTESQRIFSFSPEQRQELETAYNENIFSQVKSLLSSYTKENFENAPEIQKHQFLQTKLTTLPLYDTMVEQFLKPSQNTSLFEKITALYSPISILWYTDSCEHIPKTSSTYTQLECQYRVQNTSLYADTHIQEIYELEVWEDGESFFQFFPVSDTEISSFSQKIAFISPTRDVYNIVASLELDISYKEKMQKYDSLPDSWKNESQFWITPPIISLTKKYQLAEYSAPIYSFGEWPLKGNYIDTEPELGNPFPDFDIACNGFIQNTQCISYSIFPYYEANLELPKGKYILTLEYNIYHPKISTKDGIFPQRTISLKNEKTPKYITKKILHTFSLTE